MAKVAIDGVFQEVRPDEYLIDLINRAGGSIPHVCYHPQLGPVQTCDTCMVEVERPPGPGLRDRSLRRNENLHQVSEGGRRPGGSI